MKKLVLLLGASLLLMAGCGAATLDGENSSSDKVVKKEEKELVVGVSLSTLNNPFFVSLENGIQKLAYEKGTKLKNVDEQDD
ncbi:MAG: D-ribose ABC transporter substrate-binding protein, partial [Carnobacterium sp.]